MWKAVARFDEFCWTDPPPSDNGAERLMHDLAKLIHHTNVKVKEIFLRAAEQRDGRQRIWKDDEVPF